MHSNVVSSKPPFRDQTKWTTNDLVNERPCVATSILVPFTIKNRTVGSTGSWHAEHPASKVYSHSLTKTATQSTAWTCTDISV